ncbi:MAG: hypothetical protein ACYCXB_08225 [Candidatus Humimicrobiaceae bacterium]
MSLEICETITPDKLTLKNSRFFKDKVQLTIEPGAECKFIKISDELYFKQKKVYFPIFKSIIFTKASKDNLPNNFALIFKGIIIKDDEIGMIDSVIQENNKKEKQKYEEYKKNLDKEISLIISSMNLEMSNQKKFLKKKCLTKSQYNENIETLVNAYTDIITIKLSKDINLRSSDRSEINKFYGNMIAGLGNNKINKDTLSGIKDPEIDCSIK